MESYEQLYFEDYRCYKDHNDKFHRIDGPAIIFPDGTEHWFFHGELHRDGGPAIWYPDGEFIMYYRFGMRHNPKGPAVLDVNRGICEWWLNDKKYSNPNDMPMNLFLSYIKWSRPQQFTK